MTVSVHKNQPAFWLDLFPRPAVEGHKYDRGHVLIFGAPELTGATRLAASACSRIGAGLITVLATEKADVYRAILPADIMVKEAKAKNIKNVSAILGGTGGINEENQKVLLRNIYGVARVLDADSLVKLASFDELDTHCVLTPHEGEFSKIFPKVSGNRQEKALQAAQLSGAHLVLKGAKTVIASPDGRLVVNEHASPYLAKAGTGDVLSGMIAGLLCQQMPVFESCCAAVWIHGEAGRRFGPGLIASDIPDMIPEILSEILS